MRLRQSLLIATAIVLVGYATLLPHTEAQVGTSTLTGTVCVVQDVYYIMAPQEDGKEMACNGDGLPNATVHLTRPGPIGNAVAGVDKTDTTDANGAFSFETLPDGAGYTLEVTRAHFTSAKLDVEVKGATVQDVMLQGEEVTQTGKVVDPQGRGIADATVSICCGGKADYYGGSPGTTTGADGSFSIATTAGYRSLSVYDAPGFEGFSEYRLVDGTPLTVKLVPLPPPDAFVKGMVRDQDGKALSGIRVDVYSYGGCCPEPMPVADPSGGGSADPAAPSSRPYVGGSNHTTTDAEGQYRLGVYSGSVSITFNPNGVAYDDGFTTKYASLEMESGQTATQDARLLRFPPKTAHLQGQVAGAGGDGLQAVSISVRSPEYGRYECSSNGMDGPGYAQGGVMEARPASADAMSMPVYYEPEPCAITIHEDGSFEGDVTPGYTIVDVYYQRWLTCSYTQDADGSSQEKCGPDYFSWTATMVLAADATTELDIQLVQRPGPDATVSGYVVDGETGKAIPGATLWFNNQDNGAYGSAETDADGSFKVRLRSGYHTITASVMRFDGNPSGYLTWQGILDVPAGDNDFDVTLTPGEELNGGYCCVMYDKGYAAPMAGSSPDAAAGAQHTSASGGGAPGAFAQGQESASAEQPTGTAEDFEDLGGGLGPYDPESRKGLLQAEAGPGAKSSPHVEAVAVLATLGLLAVARRRRA